MFSKKYLNEVSEIARVLSLTHELSDIAKIIKEVKDNKGRIFFLGVGGSAATASHAVNDFRKICGIECYAPTDNVAELTARTNDDGFETVFSNWLKTSMLDKGDLIFIMSVGGGDWERNISKNLVVAMDYALSVGCPIVGIASKDGGYLAKVANKFVIVPVVDDARVTPHGEEFASIICHLLVSDPVLQTHKAKWESIEDE
jgi:D-sedoheptulose 7-phosphate isomerase